ncbi:hypothetical protein B0A49_01155, partial [Cryomyces minteri]
MKRKRKAKPGVEQSAKKPRAADTSDTVEAPDVRRTVLPLFYPKVQTLRQYLISKLPYHSKKRKRRLEAHCLLRADTTSTEATVHGAQLAYLLDRTVVGLGEGSDQNEDKAREKELEQFSQQLSDSTLGNLTQLGSISQAEIVDFAIWLLFKKYGANRRPPHVLCHGYQRTCAAGQNGLDVSVVPGIPGIASHFPNKHVESMKHQPWSNLLPLLGKGGDRIMVDLILDCGIFIPVEGGAGNLQQLSGTPLCELKPTSMAKENHIPLPKTPKTTLAGSVASRVSGRATAAQVNKPMAIRF